MKDKIFDRVKNYMAEHQMLDGGSDKRLAVVMGISGGCDSMVMLDIFRRVQEEQAVFLIAVHVNHGIRGEEAVRDQKFVESKCKEWGIPIRVYQYDVPSLCIKQKMGHEEMGRIVRREAMDKERKKLEADGYLVKTAFAHNQNDLAETMLHHLARGTGIRGLAGIRPADGFVIRPVLCLKRSEINNYAKRRNVSYVEDSTNVQTDYTRNRIRHQLLPVMEQEINAQSISHMAETAELLFDAEQYLQKQGKQLLANCEQQKNKIILDEGFFGEEVIVQKYAVMEALEQLSGKRKDLTSVHIKQVLELEKNQVGRKIHLPYQMYAERSYRGIILGFFDDTERKEKQYLSEELELLIPGETYFKDMVFQTRIFAYEGQKILEKKYTKWLDYDTIKSSLFLRNRQSGDYMVINQSGNHKKITRCMIDEKVPQELREKILMVACENEILWWIGGRIAENHKVTSQTKKILEIKCQGGTKDE